MVRSAAIDLLGRERDPALLPALVAAYRRAARDDAERRAARGGATRIGRGRGGIARGPRSAWSGSSSRRSGRSDDYLVRRAVAERFGEDDPRALLGRRPSRSRPGAAPRTTSGSSGRYVVPAPGTPAPRATIETERGTMVVELFGADAPLTVDNFLRLVDRRYFDGSRWHRVVPNFVIQDGDPRGDGNGGPGTVIRDEINRQPLRPRGARDGALRPRHRRLAVLPHALARSRTSTGGYTVFGRLTSGSPGPGPASSQGDRIRRITR